MVGPFTVGFEVCWCLHCLDVHDMSPRLAASLDMKVLMIQLLAVEITALWTLGGQNLCAGKSARGALVSKC
jgi:hypothetical protein